MDTTRERLLEAAGQVFAERGYDRATVRAICKRAGANVGAVNYHFGDKETLYREVVGYAFRSADEVHPIDDPDRGEGPVTARIRRVVQTLLSRLITAHEGWMGQLMAREFADPSPALEDVVASHMKPLFEALERLIGEGRPDLSAEARRLHVFSLLGQCVFFGHARPVLDRLFGPDAYRREQIPTLAEHIALVFTRGLGLERPAGEAAPTTIGARA